MTPRPPRLVTVLSALAVPLVVASVVACARQTPEPAPSRAPRALTITAQRKQSQQQQDRDKADCQSLASRDATSSDTWAQIFGACMYGRGYLVQ